MSDTPRTDAVASDGWNGDAWCVSEDFARTLERENAALMSEIAQLRAVDQVALLRKAWEAGFALCRSYGDNWINFRGEQKERNWRRLLLGD